MGDPVTFVAVSGGADSTAMAMRMAERGERFSLLFTPTGNELGAVTDHVAALAARTGAPLVLPPAPTLAALIDGFGALPNNRQRWCTRMIKIQPCAAHLARHPGAVLCVGLRADEPSREGGLYGDRVTYRTPLREWGWGRRDVLAYLDAHGVSVPRRTDCALCYDQRLIEWWELWRDQPAQFAKGEAWEAQTGHTFRSPSRDTWPAALAELRREFERGRVPKDTRPDRGGRQLPLFDDHEEARRCRVCAA
jgi:hypothetical protein